MQHNCPLCIAQNEQIIFTNNLYRVVHINDEFYPGYIRLILNKHVAEMTDLDEQAAQNIFSTLLIIERQIRKILNPAKINLASLGNMVPHLHWHIIPRYKNDRHFPNPIWGNVTNTQYQMSNHLRKLEEKLIDELKVEKYILK